jgi:hypothetical protein
LLLVLVLVLVLQQTLSHCLSPVVRVKKTLHRLGNRNQSFLIG